MKWGPGVPPVAHDDPAAVHFVVPGRESLACGYADPEPVRATVDPVLVSCVLCRQRMSASEIRPGGPGWDALPESERAQIARRFDALLRDSIGLPREEAPYRLINRMRGRRP